MKWVVDWGKVGNVLTDLHIATGKMGKFTIWFNGKYYHACYVGDFVSFRFPRTKTLKEMKALCENNTWWEK